MGPWGISSLPPPAQGAIFKPTPGNMVLAHSETKPDSGHVTATPACTSTGVRPGHSLGAQRLLAALPCWTLHCSIACTFTLLSSEPHTFLLSYACQWFAVTREEEGSTFNSLSCKAWVWKTVSAKQEPVVRSLGIFLVLLTNVRVNAGGLKFPAHSVCVCVCDALHARLKITEEYIILFVLYVRSWKLWNLEVKCMPKYDGNKCIGPKVLQEVEG